MCQEIQEGLRSNRTSFLHIKSEEDYYDKRERVMAEREEKIERMEHKRLALESQVS